MLMRAISALIALPIALTLIHMGGWWFAGLLVFATGVCSYEFAMMSNPKDRPTAIVCATLAGAAIIAIAKGWVLRPEALPLVAMTLLGLILWFLFRPGAIETAGHRLGVTITGLFWSVLFMAGLMCLRLTPDGLAWLYLACGLAWGSDTGAYFAGKYLGKRKLYPAVSPNKTWAGAVGGVISATIIAVIIQKIFSAPAIPLEHMLVIAPIGAALGQMGDLCESLIKRSMGVKDSGKIMPGHGGLLDRVDALFFTGTWLFVYAFVVAKAQAQWL
jgi:phosphatidate cytidylyltransferase